MCDPNDFRWHLDPDEVDRVLHHGHIIPLSRGITRDFLAEHYPGWTWNGLSGLLRSAGIVGPGGVSGRCDRRVRVVHVDLPAAVCVEWEAGAEPNASRR